MPVEQRSNSLESNVGQRFSLGNPNANTVFFLIFMEQARCRCVPLNAFLDAALVYYGNTTNHDRVPKTPFSFPTECHFT